MLMRIFIFLASLSVNYSAVADNQITDAQILRIAKIAKATGTDIRIVKETTTVTVFGRYKKVNKKVKRTVMNLLKQNPHKQDNWEKLTSATPSLAHIASHPPVLEGAPGSAKAPTLDAQNTGYITMY